MREAVHHEGSPSWHTPRGENQGIEGYELQSKPLGFACLDPTVDADDVQPAVVECEEFRPSFQSFRQYRGVIRPILHRGRKEKSVSWKDVGNG